MNPFVNSHKRSFLLPHGRKNLLEPPAPARRESSENIRKFIGLILQMAREDDATEVVIKSAAPESTHTAIRYKVGAEWYDLSPFPTRIRCRVVNELMKQAGVAKASYPREGLVVTQLVGAVQVWRFRIAEPHGECTLTAVKL